MPVRVIPRQAWTDFLRSFTTQHYGWLVTIGSHDREGRSLIHLEQRPLDEIQFDGKILAVRSGEELHRIEEPTEIAAEETDQGVISGLRIVNRGGTTEIRFRTTVAPELVDGMIP